MYLKINQISDQNVNANKMFKDKTCVYLQIINNIVILIYQLNKIDDIILYLSLKAIPKSTKLIGLIFKSEIYKNFS